jgi:hypothetical protein
MTTENSGSEFHDQADANWIVIRGPLRGHNDTPCGRPTPGRPVGCLGAAALKAYFVFSITINTIFNIVLLIMEFTWVVEAEDVEVQKRPDGGEDCEAVQGHQQEEVGHRRPQEGEDGEQDAAWAKSQQIGGFQD